MRMRKIGVDHNNEVPVMPLGAYLCHDPCLRALLLLSCWEVDAFVM